MAGKSLNKVTLIGNLGRDPELRYTNSGIPVATFSIATNEQWKDSDGNTQEKTEWHNIVTWQKLAEICAEYLKKGSKVYIEGRLQTRSWDDKNTGQKRTTTEIVANDMIMLDSRSSGGRSTETPTATVERKGEAEKDDLPF
jgi:single-strand DNA-binding protein